MHAEYSANFVYDVCFSRFIIIRVAFFVCASPRPHVPTSPRPHVPTSQPTRATSQTRVPRLSPQVTVPLFVTAGCSFSMLQGTNEDLRHRFLLVLKFLYRNIYDKLGISALDLNGMYSELYSVVLLSKLITFILLIFVSAQGLLVLYPYDKLCHVCLQCNYSASVKSHKY